MSSVSPMSSCPRRKLSTTNSRRSRRIGDGSRRSLDAPPAPLKKPRTARMLASVEWTGRRRLGDGADEMVDEQLGGEDADERHVVLHADRPTLAELAHERRDRRRIEDAVGGQARRREQLLDIVLRAARIEEAGP